MLKIPVMRPQLVVYNRWVAKLLSTGICIPPAVGSLKSVAGVNIISYSSPEHQP